MVRYTHKYVHIVYTKLVRTDMSPFEYFNIFVSGHGFYVTGFTQPMPMTLLRHQSSNV